MKSMLSDDGGIIAGMIERLIRLLWHVRSDAASCSEAYWHCAIAQANPTKSFIDTEWIFDPFCADTLLGEVQGRIRV